MVGVSEGIVVSDLDSAKLPFLMRLKLDLFLDYVIESQILSKSHRGLLIPWKTSHD